MKKVISLLKSILPLVVQRLVFGLLVLLAISYLGYFGLEMARGSSFSQSLGQAAEKTVVYLGQLASGDLGTTTAGTIMLRAVPIVEVVPVVVARSLALLLAAMLIAAPIGITLGIWASRWRNTRWSLPILLVSIVGISIPSFFAALLLQMAVIRLTQVSGRTWLPVGGFGWDLHILLPALVLAARPLAQLARVTFVTLNDILDQDYVRTAYSKGLTSRMVMDRHVLINAAVPVLTTLGISLRFSLSSLPVVEYFFGWPGMGFTLLKSISRQDDVLTVVLILCLGILFILVNLFIDLACRVFDPRLRAIPEHIMREGKISLLERFRSALAVLTDIRDRFFRRRKAAPEKHLQEQGFKAGRLQGNTAELEYVDRGQRRAWVQGTLKNPALILGVFLLAGLSSIILFSPLLTPHSPYTTQGLTIVNGEFKVPPFPPDDIYPWGSDVLGRDMMSLILAGAQQTLMIAILVVIARMLIGFVLGALAGWTNGSWLDRTLVGASEVISAFPTLLLAMTLILALGIRQGISTFVIALCFVGWGEIMQFVRSEVITIQSNQFVESAIAVGQRTYRIILHHVLPNLILALISIAALEMGAVLMILGELGFIGIFIGGGAFAELDVFGAPYHYSDVPEWGALLSNVRTYARSYPWMALYPSLAFFLAILGFNLLGEGLRRMVDVVGVRVMRLFNRYTLAVVLILGVAFFYVRGQTGALAYYQRQAEAFDGAQSMAYLEVLADPDLQGRALGSPGLQGGAEYIAQQFAELGVQPAGADLTYFQPRTRSYFSLDAIPRLHIEDGGADPVYHQDFVERPSPTRNLGEYRSAVRFLAFGELMQGGQLSYQYNVLQELDLSDQIVMVLSEADAAYLDRYPMAGLLVVQRNPLDLQRRYTLSPNDPRWSIFGPSSDAELGVPMFWISESTADRILQDSGQTVETLRRLADDLEQDEIFELETGVTVDMEIQGSVEERFVTHHVIGYIPGESRVVGGATGEGKLDDKMIVVMAQYDSPPLGPDGEDYLAANDNASGVAVMLEMIRSMRDAGYQPYKTFLFVAYSGEGIEGGARYVPEVAKFLQTKYGFSGNYQLEAIVELRGMGTQVGDQLILYTGGSLRLADLFEAAARRMDVPVRRAGGDVDISIVFEERSAYAGGEEAPTIGLAWEGWQVTANSSADTLDTVSQDHLELSGEALNLAMMILGRETDY